MRLTKRKINSLKDFYLNTGYDKSFRAFFEFRMEFGIYMIFLLMYVFVKTGEPDKPRPFMFYIFMLYFGIRGDLRKKREKKIRNKHRKLTDSDFSEIQESIQKLALKMGVNYDIEFYYNRNNHNIPNILKSIEDSIIFILPRNIFSLFHRNKKHFEAIIAHELSHIKKKDTNLWWDFERYKDMGLTICLASIVATYYEPVNIITFIAIGYIVFYLIFYIPGLKKKRKKSELYADIGSLIYTEHDGMIEVLKGGYLKDVETKLHPSISERIKNLNEAMKNHT